MSIKFACRCGKHLKVQDHWAGRRFPCPACGHPVGVPSLEAAAAPQSTRLERDPPPSAAPHGDGPVSESTSEPTPESSGSAPEIEGPLYFRLRRSRDPNRAGEAPWVPVEGALLPSPEEKVRIRARRKRYNWRLEEHWYESLVYPGRAWPIVVGLGVALALSTGSLLRLWARGADMPPTEVMTLPMHLLWIVVSVVYTVAVLDCTLSAALAGEYRAVRWPAADLVAILRSCGVWLAAFATGPALAAALTCWYWLSCGELQPVDRIILFELLLLTVGYWLLAVMAVTQAGSFRGLAPAHVFELGGRLWPRGVLLLAVITGMGAAHGSLAWAALEDLHRDPFWGYVALVLVAVSGLYWAMFLLRLLGLAGFRSLAAAPTGQPLSGEAPTEPEPSQ